MTDIYGYVHGLKTKNVVAICIITIVNMIISMLLLLIFCIILMDYYNTENIRNPKAIDDTLGKFSLTAHGYDVIKPPQVQHYANKESTYAKVDDGLFRQVGRKHDELKKQDRRKRRAVHYFKLREKHEQQEKERAEPQVGYGAAAALSLTRLRGNCNMLYEKIGPITMEAGTLRIPFKHATGNKTCDVIIDSKIYSSKEKQDAKITVESSETSCTLFIQHFTLETYANVTASVDADLQRILDPIRFGKLLKDRHAAIDNCENDHDDKGLSPGAVVGIVVGILVLLIVPIVIFCIKRRKVKKGYIAALTK